MEHTKGELEYSICTTNAIDIISKEKEDDIVAQIIAGTDELSAKDYANAREFVRRWNAFEDGGSYTELLAACELSMKILEPSSFGTFKISREDIKTIKAAIAAAEEKK